MSTVKAKARCPSFFIRSTVSLFPALWGWLRLLGSRWYCWRGRWWWGWWNVDYCSLTVLMSHVTTIAPSRANLHRNHQRHQHNCCQKQDQHDNDHCHLWHISLPMPDPPPVTRTTCPLMSLWNTCTANSDLWGLASGWSSSWKGPPLKSQQHQPCLEWAAWPPPRSHGRPSIWSLHPARGWSSTWSLKITCFTIVSKILANWTTSELSKDEKSHVT